MLNKLVLGVKIMRNILVSISLLFSLVLLLHNVYSLFLAQDKISIFPKQPIYL